MIQMKVIVKRLTCAETKGGPDLSILDRKDPTKCATSQVAAMIAAKEIAVVRMDVKLMSGRDFRSRLKQFLHDFGFGPNAFAY